VDDHPSSIADSEDPTVYSTFLNSRPERFEVDAISRIIDLQKEFPTLRCHIVHLSAARALPIIRSAKAAGHKLTVETCFHYLCLASDSIPDGRPEFKCCPPIRDAANREALWAALLDGTIDCVVSDHSPCVAELKKLDQGDVMGAWGGISTLGFGLSLLWMEGRKRKVPIGTILRWVSENTASHAGLGDRKGKIAVGYDADLIIWDPDAQYTVRLSALLIFSKDDLIVGSRSRRRRFSSRTRSLRTKVWCSRGKWSRRYFVGVRSTTELRILSLTWSHREYFCETFQVASVLGVDR
jgi:allantoinase